MVIRLVSKILIDIEEKQVTAAVKKGLQKEKIIDVWTKKLFHEIRKSLLNGDRSHKPCNKCDVNGLISGNEFKTKWQEYYQKKI